MKNKNKITCDVTNCNHNNEEGECVLDEVCISCQCDGDDCTCTSSTICQSFDSSGGVITDNVYEVSSEFDDALKEEIAK